MGECSVYISVQVDLRGQVCSLAYVLAATWRGPTFIQMTRVNSRNCFFHKLYHYKYVLL